MKYDEPNLLVVLGPTASGKTRLAVQLAYQLQSGVISADSRQVYRHMDIGTGKDLNEYILDNQQIPYHLIDILEPGDQYDVAQFQRDVLQIIPQYTPPNIPVLCGGTGLYIQAILANHQFTQIPIDEEKRTFWQKAGFEMKRICVFCGSQSGANPLHAEMARQLGRELAVRGLTLVYGGGRVGLMGVAARACKEGGGRVIGIIPSMLMTTEIAQDGLVDRIFQRVRNAHAAGPDIA